MPNDLSHKLGFDNIKSGKLDEALNYFEHQRAIDRRKRKRDPKNDNILQYGIARVHFAKGELDAAERILESLLKTIPTWHCPYLTLGRIYELRNDFEAALGIYERGIVQCKLGYESKITKLESAKQWLLAKIEPSSQVLLYQFQEAKTSAVSDNQHQEPLVRRAMSK